jgi:hypothetical protein
MTEIPNTPRTLTSALGAGSSDRSLAWTANRTAIMTVSALALAIVVRAWLVLSRDFPLNDGGLFFRMTEELAANGFRLPATTSYNSAGIPFAYSPLAFYLGALLHAALGIELVDVVRFVPLAFTALCVLAFWLLARDLIPSRAVVVAALCIFAVLPRSFLWLVMGGGLTRAPGLFFAILALWQLHRALTRESWRHVGWATVCAALTVLSHLGTAPFVAFSGALMMLFFGRNRFGVVALLAMGCGTLVLTAPWWLTIILTHGIDPILAAGATGGTVFNTHTRGEALTKLAYFGLGTAEPLFPIIGALAILGTFASITRRGAFLALWWLLIILLDVRAGATYASIPVAILAAIALIEVIVPIVARPPSWEHGASENAMPRGWSAAMLAPRHRQIVVGVVLTVLLGYGVASSMTRQPGFNAEGRFLTSLTGDDRTAMSWVARHTPPDSRFLVMVGGAAGGWWADRVGEWFPVLANRVSVATVQGTEWLPNHLFQLRERQYNQVQGCAGWQVTCVDDWSVEHALPFDYIYIPRTLAFPCCEPLERALQRDASVRVVFSGPGATIYERRPLTLN